jgi:Predicted membrane protein
MTEPVPGAAERPFRHHGRSRDIVALALMNLLFNILTLSWWRFWGKTRVRRFLWSHTTLWGDPLDYTGTGRELFLGFLVVVFLVFSPLMIVLTALQAALETGQAWAGAAIIAIQVFFVFLAGAGLYRAYRYQMTRTRWRAVRAGLDGAAWQYGLHVLGVALAVSVSLGWALPWGQMKLLRYRLDHTLFGDLAFECDARARGLYGRFAVVWLFGLLALAALLWFGVLIARMGGTDALFGREGFGIAFNAAAFLCLSLLWCLAYAWYKAAFYRELAAHTRFGGHAFALDAHAWPLFGLAFGNALISLLSLGVLAPWAAVRTFRFVCSNLTMAGQPDFDRVNQTARTAPRLGEGLATVFDGAGSF